MKSRAGNGVPRNEYVTPAAYLIATLFLFGANKITSPTPGLDPSWRTGIDAANALGMHFGRDIIFTLGPLGFLETAQSISRAQMILSMVFSLTATATLWTIVYLRMARTTHRITAAVTAAIIVGVISGNNSIMSSLMILISASIIALSFIKSDGSGYLQWTPAAISAVAAILVQVKFSEGLVLIGIAVLSSFFGPSRTLRRIVASAFAFCATFTITWLMTGQSFESLPSWVSGSMDLVLGYSEAMGSEIKPNLLSYLIAIFLIIAVMRLTLRWIATDTPRARLGILLVVLCLLGFSFKQGFTRHDAHDQLFFAVTAVLLATLLVSAKWPAAIIGLLATSLVFSSSGIGFGRFDPIVAREAWKSNLQLIMDSDYQQLTNRQAAFADRSYYSLSAPIVSEARGHPVSVDPWEATLAWAYGFNWHPVPIFQTYVAYTATLDQMNADAMVNAPNDQVVIRGLPTSIDGRNPMWETPRYLLAIACNYVVGPSDQRWMTLRKSGQRCSAPSEVSTVRVNAGRQITLPDEPAGKILVGHFTPEASSHLSRIVQTFWKEPSPLLVYSDSVAYRLPRALADGPLMLRVPGSLGWPDAYGGNLHYGKLVFGEPGTLRLETVTIER